MTKPFLFPSSVALLLLAAFRLGAEEPVPRVTLEGLTGSAMCLDFSPDGKLLASGSTDNTITLWELGSAKKLKTLSGHISPVVSLAFSSDGKKLASGVRDGTVRQWNVVSGKTTKTLKLPSEFHRTSFVDYRPNGQLLTALRDGKSIRLYHGDRKPKLLGHDLTVYALAISPDGSTLASGIYSGAVSLWDSVSGKRVNHFSDSQTRAGSIYSLALSADGKWLAIGDSYASLRIFSRKNFRSVELMSYGDEIESVDFLAFHPKSTLLAAGIGHARNIELWDPISHKRIAVLPCQYPTSLAFSPDGRSLASGHAKSIKLWDMQSVTNER